MGRVSIPDRAPDLLRRDRVIIDLRAAGIQDGVADLVAHFVGVTFGDRLRSEKIIFSCHVSSPFMQNESYIVIFPAAKKKDKLSAFW